MLPTDTEEMLPSSQAFIDGMKQALREMGVELEDEATRLRGTFRLLQGGKQRPSACMVSSGRVGPI